MTTSIFPGVCAVAWKAAQSRQSALVCFSGSGGREKCLLAQDALQKPTLPASPCVILHHAGRVTAPARPGPQPTRPFRPEFAARLYVCPALTKPDPEGCFCHQEQNSARFPDADRRTAFRQKARVLFRALPGRLKKTARPRGPCELGRPDDKPGLRRRPGPRFPSWTAEARAYFSVTVPCGACPGSCR